MTFTNWRQEPLPLRGQGLDMVLGEKGGLNYEGEGKIKGRTLRRGTVICFQ
jgi:hypothetical protein